MLTAIRIAGFKAQPICKIHCNGNITARMIFLVCSFLIIIIRHHVAIIRQSVKIRQTKTRFFRIVINRNQRRNAIHFFQRILRLQTIGIFKIQVSVKIEYIFAHVQFQTGIILRIIIAKKNTFFVCMVIRYRIKGFVRTATNTYHVILR